MENLFGTKIRSLREAQGLMQRHVAYHLDIDSPMLSNVEPWRAQSTQRMDS
jgi:transcriptional regulator with XRE-family HTH domain